MFFLSLVVEKIQVVQGTYFKLRSTILTLEIS